MLTSLINSTIELEIVGTVKVDPEEEDEDENPDEEVRVVVMVMVMVMVVSDGDGVGNSEWWHACDGNVIVAVCGGDNASDSGDNE